MSVGNIGGYSGLRSTSDMAATNATSSKTADMGSGDFLTLLTTQLQNQDPFQPMENGEFLGQLAQMSTVRGIDDLNATLSTMATQMSGSLISQASGMLGQGALVTGSLARPDEQGTVAGRANLEEYADTMVIEYTDAETGDVLHSQSLTDQYAGPVEFSWDGAPTDGRQIRIKVTAANADGTLDASTQVYARIEGVEVDSVSGEMTLQIQDYGAFLGSEITALR
ncbi:flagellar hook assembly protein FlgD [Thalassovita aquimarina]|uniref:Basal-body rod modification protein FlgD n=1 Tax=Thalassovita aquimarina TaxID=2785917 RepID=A0ABS5HKZ8_9RHOB|nr:flagellar hook capping FlgD N-terminal domain-containing protein [Thalassovita aquimarina]MBR9649650.1 flagellar biosynthesis protein FlgD [Thalassovita aquimarina]